MRVELDTLVTQTQHYAAELRALAAMPAIYGPDLLAARRGRYEALRPHLRGLLEAVTLLGNRYATAPAASDVGWSRHLFGAAAADLRTALAMADDWAARSTMEDTPRA